MLDTQLSVSAANHAGQMQMRQQILDFLAEMVNLADEQEEANILHDVLTAVNEEVEPVTPFATDRAAIRQTITRAELDATARDLFKVS